MYNFSSLQYTLLHRDNQKGQNRISPLILSSSHTDATALRELVLDPVADDYTAGAPAVAEWDVRRAGDVDMVAAGDEGTDPPLDPAGDLDGEADGAGGLVLAEGEAVVGCDGDVVAVEERGPDVEVMVALVDGRDGGGVGDLLAVVGGVGGEAVVVDADSGVGVVGGGGDDVWGGDVEGEDGGVLEDESGLVGLEDGPDYEDEEDEDEESGAEAAEDFLPLVFVVAADLLRHGGGGIWGKKFGGILRGTLVP
ncbi:hypothetical protein STAS_18573 [Striga asiatica]|uniref:Uncharacterized protein n=1 Tax=Striga asiatica TaxID=4170 RepID=A0A5A7QCZ2_STRAF|nr:hypothetical protein STAS_18573 [Striga asiatica]